MKKYLSTICCVLCLLIITISCNSKSYIINAESDVTTDCKSAIIVDYNSGEVLFSKNSDAKMQVASIVKLMTSLITLEKIDNGELKLEDKVLTTENASGMGGSQIFIDPYENYSIEDLLKGVIVASANDAAVALAEHISGSEQEFVKLMNEKAKKLGMNNTLYANATGLPEPEQYSSAKDCSIILKELFNHKTYFNYSSIWMDELVHPSGRKTELVNTNKLIRYFKGCDIGKTGFTDEAGYCLVASAERDGMRYIACCLGANEKQKRFNEVSKLLNYGFTNFENSNLVNKNNIIETIKVNGSNIKEINVYAEEDFVALKKKGTELKYEISYNVPKQIKAPLKSGESIGKIIIAKDGNVVKEIDIVIREDVNKLSYKQAVEKVVSNW